MTNGLLVFIAVNIVNVAVLLMDLAFVIYGVETITDRVRGGDYWLGGIIIAWEIFGVLGITEHFFFGVLWR